MIGFLRKFRKTHLTNYVRVYYSQFGEDVVLRSIFGRTRNGFYVDVGCYHPKKFSNTYALYRRGWRGINIDFEQHKIDLFNLARPDDDNVVAEVGDREDVYFIESKRSHDLEARLTEKSASRSARPVKTTTLTNVIAGTKYRNRPIDLLSIDTEGHDEQVLRSLDFETYRPTCVVIECLCPEIRGILDSSLHQFLESKGYALVSWTVASLIYNRRATPNS